MRPIPVSSQQSPSSAKSLQHVYPARNRSPAFSRERAKARTRPRIHRDGQDEQDRRMELGCPSILFVLSIPVDSLRLPSDFALPCRNLSPAAGTRKRPQREPRRVAAAVPARIAGADQRVEAAILPDVS